MDLPISTSPRFDLNQASAQAIAEQFPLLGLFCAEDVVAWREKHGPITSADALIQELGVPADLADSLVADLARNVTHIPGDGEFSLVEPVPPSKAPETGGPRMSDDAPPRPASAAPPVVFLPVTAEPAARISKVPELTVTMPPAPELMMTMSKAPEPLVSMSRAPGKLAFTSMEPDRPLPESRPRSPLAALVATRIAEEEGKLSAFVSDADAEKSAMDSIFLPESGGEVTSPGIHLEVAAVVAASDGPREVGSGKARSWMPWFIAGIVVLNAGIAGFLMQVYTDGKKMHAPVVAMTAEMTGLKDEEEKARAELSATRELVAKQARELASTTERVAAVEARQHEVSHEIKEQTLKVTRNTESMNARMRQIEVRADKQTFDVGEAMKLIDDVQGRQPTVSTSQ